MRVWAGTQMRPGMRMRAADDEAGAWELLKRRVAENRKLSTENRKLRNDLGESRVSQPSDPAPSRPI